MKSAGRKLTRVTIVALVLTAWPVAASEFMLNPALHASMTRMGERWGGGFDLVVSAAWLPVPEVGLGLDVAIMAPLYAGSAEGVSSTDMTLRACPVVWLRFGDDSAWGFVKAGAGISAHLIEGEFEPVMVVVAGGGFVVAPRWLPYHFGFEILGELGVVGSVDTGLVGLGGFVGWMF
jgi:hypothetical protein